MSEFGRRVGRKRIIVDEDWREMMEVMVLSF